LVHEIFRAEELAERHSAHSVDHAGLEVVDLRAGHVFSARSLVVKNVGAVQLRVVVAAVPAVTANVVIVAQHLQKPVAHLVTELVRLHVHNPAQRSSLKAGSTRGGKWREGAEKRRKLRVVVWQGKQEMP
jgi:hypothetical protein